MSSNLICWLKTQNTISNSKGRQERNSKLSSKTNQALQKLSRRESIVLQLILKIWRSLLDQSCVLSCNVDSGSEDGRALRLAVPHLQLSVIMSSICSTH